MSRATDPWTRSCIWRRMKAEDWIGYLEHSTPEDLDVFDANVGKGGCTIFAALVERREGSCFMGLPWCAVFVFAVIGRPDVLGPACAGVVTLARRMKRRGLWRGRDYCPKQGDIVFCSNLRTRRADHCGIVEHCDSETVYSIDGNTVDPGGRFRPAQGGAVARRERQRGDRVIAGYAAIGSILQADA